MLERKHNDKGYSPTNCVWTTPKGQIRNRRNTRWVITTQGRMTVAEAAERFKIPYTTLLYRVNRFGEKSTL